MFHWRARRLLPRLLDEDLPEEIVLDLEVHVASCARCRRVRREHERSERLLLKMPTAFAPLKFDASSYARLVTLTRWSEEPDLPRPERWNAPILALTSAAVIVMLAATMSHWSPMVRATVEPVTLAPYQPDSVYLPATGNSGRF